MPSPPSPSVSLRGLSIRNRLALGNIALLALSLLVFAGATRFVIGAALRRSLDIALREQAEETRKMMARGFFPPDHGGNRNSGGDPNRRRNDWGPYGRNRDGRGVDDHDPFAGGPNDAPPNDDQNPDNPYRPPNEHRSHHGPPPGPRFGTASLLLPYYVMPNQPAKSANRLRPPYSREGILRAIQGREDWREVVFNNEAVRVFTLPALGGNSPVVQTAVPLTETLAATNLVTYSLGLLLPALALVAGVGGYTLTRRALTPVRRLTEAAARIEANRLSDRLPEPGGGDEFDALAKRLNAMLAGIDVAFVRQKQFTAHASHELRTPLAVIKTATTLLQGNMTLPPALQAEAVQSADEAADRANRLLKDLFFLTRVENGVVPVHPTELLLAKVAQTALNNGATVARNGTLSPLSMREESLNASHAALKMEVEAGLHVTVDYDLLLRLLVNLVNNALRHTPPEGTVAIRAERVTGGGTLIYVADTGSGIAPEHLARLGEPFYRPDVARTREEGGAGLGLSICKSIAHTLGGSLTFQSTVGVGTTVTIALPAYPPG